MTSDLNKLLNLVEAEFEKAKTNSESTKNEAERNLHIGEALGYAVVKNFIAELKFKHNDLERI